MREQQQQQQLQQQQQQLQQQQWQQSSQTIQPQVPTQVGLVGVQMSPIIHSNITLNSTSSGGMDKKDKKKKKKAKKSGKRPMISKADIGAPQTGTFKHIDGAGKGEYRNLYK